VSPVRVRSSRAQVRDVAQWQSAYGAFAELVLGPSPHSYICIASRVARCADDGYFWHPTVRIRHAVATWFSGGPRAPSLFAREEEQ